MIDQYQQQRQRVTMSITKQYSNEASDKINSVGLRAIPLTERKTDDSTMIHDNSSVTSSKTVSSRPDNMPINLVSRYDTTTLTQLTSLNRMQTIVRSFFFVFVLNNECLFFFKFYIENIKFAKASQINALINFNEYSSPENILVDFHYFVLRFIQMTIFLIILFYSL